MSTPNPFTPEQWYSTLVALEVFYIGLWLLAAMAIAFFLTINQVFSLPSKQIKLSFLDSRFFWQILYITAFILRLPRLFTDFWYDETFTGVMARLPLDNFLIALLGDVHPPLHYLIARLFMAVFGDNEIALRLPSLIAGLLFIFIVYRLAYRLTDDYSVSKLSALLVAVLPTLIHYSGEARYPMLLALAVCTAWLALLEDRKILFSIAACSVALLHATGIVYAGVLLVGAVYVAYRHKALKWLISVFVVASVAGLYILAVAVQVSDFSNGFWLWRMSPAWHLVEGVVLMPTPPMMIIIYIAVIILFLSASLAMIRQNKRLRFIWFGLAIFPPVSLFVLGIVWHPVYLPRALIASAVIPLIGWSWLAVHAQKSYIYQSLIGIVVCLSLISYVGDTVDDFKDLTFKDVFAICGDSEYIYTTSTNMSIASEYYAPRRSLAFFDGNNQHQELSFETREAMGFNLAPPEIIASDYCFVVNWNYYTTPQEIAQIENIKRYYPYTSQLYELDAFGIYEIIFVGSHD